MLGDFVRDLHEGQPVDPGADEGPKLGVRINPALDAGAMLAAVIGGERLACGKAFKALVNSLLKGHFKPVESAILGGARCLQFSQGSRDERGCFGHLALLEWMPACSREVLRAEQAVQGGQDRG